MRASPSKSVSLNSDFIFENGVYSHPQASRELSDDPQQKELLKSLSALDDCSAFSVQIEEMLGQHAALNFLKPQLFSAFDFSSIKTVLEISNDAGNIARYLAEQGEQLDSIKTQINPAQATIYRCADLAGVNVFNSPLSEVKLPKGHYDLIVVDNLEALAESTETKKLIAKLSSALSEQGVLLLSHQNKQPLSDWFSLDQIPPYAPLYQPADQRLSADQWQALLSDNGIEHFNEQCVLPDSQQPRTLLSKSYLQQNHSSLNHFYGSGLTNGAPVNDYLLFSRLTKQRDLYDLVDSYYLLAGKDNDALKRFYNNDFSHFSSSGRRRQWRTLTQKKAEQASVEKSLLLADKSSKSDSGLSLSQDLSCQQYLTGQSLVGLWLESLLDNDDKQTKTLPEYWQDYASWLKDNQQQWGDALYDILPFNLIVDDKGNYQVIDAEWKVESDLIAPEFIMFRALFWFAFHNRELLQEFANKQGLFSVQDFVVFAMQLVGYEISDLSAFIQIENQIQSQIETQFSLNAIQDSLRLPLLDRQKQRELVQLPKPLVQIFCYNKDDEIYFENSISSTVNDKGIATLNLTELDTNLDCLRLDPVDYGGFFQIDWLEFRDKEDKVICAFKTQQSIVETAKLVNLNFTESPLGSVFIALNDDPQLLFDIKTINDLSKTDKLTISVRYLGGIEYNLAMQELGHNNFLQQQFIGSQYNRIEELKANVEFLKLNLQLNSDHQVNLTKQNQRLTNLVAEQQKHIESQQQLMARSLLTRIKLFTKRALGRVVPQAIVEQEQRDREGKKRRESLHKTDVLQQNNEDYVFWIEQNKLSEQDILQAQAEIEKMALKPTFSIVVPVYNIEEEYLMMAVDSLRKQIYPHWQLCLVDDASPSEHIRPLLKRLAASDKRIKIQLNKENKGIGGASNDGLKLATGDYTGLLDHDDELSIDALYENAKVINQYPDVGFIYSDEDKITMQGQRVDPFFKPDFSPDMLDSQNYICHFSVISQDVIKQIGGFRLGFDGSQDHDLIMRAVTQAERVIHIPKILYHWRKVPGSTADVYDAKSYAWEAGRKAVEARLKASNEAGEVVLGPMQGTYQVKREIIDAPKVSIIIPFKDKADLLKMCVESITEKTDYAHFEIIGVSNNSEQTETYELMEALSDQYDNIRFVVKDEPFNFSQLCNYGVSKSSGEYILLLNNDIEIINNDWLERLLEHAQRPEVGAVGGKLLFPDGRIQHAGVVVGMHGAAGHLHLYFAGNSIGYYSSLLVTRNTSAVTGAMLMVSREKYHQVNGLDEQNLAVAYNDVDFCLKLLDAGFINVITPFCQATHYESASRGYEDDPQKQARFEKEKNFFLNKWADFIEQGDPYYNPNFDLNAHNFKIKLKET